MKHESQADIVRARFQHEVETAERIDAILDSLPEGLPLPFVHIRKLYGVCALVRFGGFGNPQTISKAIEIAKALPSNVGSLWTWDNGCRYVVSSKFLGSDSVRANELAQSLDKGRDNGSAVELADVRIDAENPYEGVTVSWHHVDSAGRFLQVKVAIGATESRRIVDRRIEFATTEKGEQSSRVLRDNCYDQGQSSAAPYSIRWSSGRDDGTSNHSILWYLDETCEAVTPVSILESSL